MLNAVCADFSALSDFYRAQSKELTLTFKVVYYIIFSVSSRPSSPRLSSRKNKTKELKLKMNRSVKRVMFVTYSAIIAALYIVLTLISSIIGLSSGVIQLRFSEALSVLPFFTPAAIPGLFIGCMISNLLSGAIIIDVLFGSIATLIGAIFTYLLRKLGPYSAPLPPILANVLIIPFVLKYAYHLDDALWLMFGTVLAGEVVSCGVFGLILLFALKKHESRIFPK